MTPEQLEATKQFLKNLENNGVFKSNFKESANNDLFNSFFGDIFNKGKSYDDPKTKGSK